MIAQLDMEQIRLRPGRAMARLVSHLLLQGRPLTTSSRWLNSIIFGQFSLVKRLPQLKVVQKPIFILGTGRSGTTILGKLLSLHPDILFLNEPKAMWYAVQPLDDVIGSYTRGEACYRLDETAVTPIIKKNAQQLYGYSLFLTHSRRILDKYPEMIFRVPFLQAIFPDAKFLFLTRNGWDTCRSIEKWSRTDGTTVNQEIHDWWGADQRKWHMLVRDIVAYDPLLAPDIRAIQNLTRQEDMAAVEWLVTMREGLQLMQRLPNHIHQVPYEQLVAEPKTVLNGILSFCEMPSDSKLIDYARHTLKQQPLKGRFDLHPAIKSPFQETLEILGHYPLDN